MVYNRGGLTYQKCRRYVADIDISVSVRYPYFIYCFFQYIDIISVTNEILVIYILIFCHTFSEFLMLV